MNREILFRGFHPCDGPDTIVVDGEKVKGRWVEGDFLPDCNGDTYITACNKYRETEGKKVMPPCPRSTIRQEPAQ